MANSDYKSVDGYIASQSEASRTTLERVRGIIRKAVPGTEETISYQIPAYNRLLKNTSGLLPISSI